jgi:hypothetical protein
MWLVWRREFRPLHLVDLGVTEVHEVVATGFHSGELAVQRRVGVQRQAARLSTMVERGELRDDERSVHLGAVGA